jgi:hypothetical protein
VTEPKQENVVPQSSDNPAARAERKRLGLKLFRRLIIYHVVLIGLLVAAAIFFPALIDALPIGGIDALELRGDLTVADIDDLQEQEIVGSLAQATNRLDELGYARQLIMVLVGVTLLILPVSWVNKGIHRTSVHDHSLDETTLILPGVVAAIVLVVQHSLALAFSLAGIIAGVQFRRALQDTFDALFILVAIGTGIAAGVEALEIAAVLTVFFSYATLFVYFYGDGLQSDYDEKKKQLKRQRKAAEAKAAGDDDDE